MISVHFYHPRSFSPPALSLVGWMIWVLHETLWRGDPIHSNIEVGGIIYDTSWKGTHRVKASRYPAKPIHTVDVVHPDPIGVLRRAEKLSHFRYEYHRSVLDALHLLPARTVQPLHCASLVAMALGLEKRCHRPIDLLDALLENESHGRRRQINTTTES